MKKERIKKIIKNLQRFTNSIKNCIQPRFPRQYSLTTLYAFCTFTIMRSLKIAKTLQSSDGYQTINNRSREIP